MSAYKDREQTQAKHFILRGYLQELAFKVLNSWDIVYVDGFSGPWESKTEDFSDTSFKIALEVLTDAQKAVSERTGKRRRVKCFFSEKNRAAYEQMVQVVGPYHRPDQDFEVTTYHGEFVDAVDNIRTFIGRSFPLIFIDPTGWTEYPLDRIAPLFSFSRCEVLVNFMYNHIARFPTHPDPKIIASLDPILGGPGWQKRLDPNLSKGLAVEKLFRDNLKAAGKFAYVVSTKIDKSTENRPHFFLVYGTKDRAGLLAFRRTEFQALKDHARNRSAAKTRMREARAGAMELFAEHEADQQEATIEAIVDEQIALATCKLLELLGSNSSLPFTRIVDRLLQEFMLRETNVKNICLKLASAGTIENSWGARPRKPNDETIIRIVR